MRRGFKAEAERIASATRAELGLRIYEALDPLSLAKHLAIPVLALSNFTKTPFLKSDFVKYFSRIDQDCFSAITIFVGTKRIIVHNDTHHPNRQASNLSHEISHCLLEHEPSPLKQPNGQRYWDPAIEEEASWLGAALLIPRDGALRLLRSGEDASGIAARYGTSSKLAEWRLRESGVYVQVSRSLGRY